MYLNKAKQEQMIVLMNKYLEISNAGENTSYKTDKIMKDFFLNYADLIINGVLYTPPFKFWRFAEIDDLVQEARLALIMSIHKQQWDPERGTIFNFFTTVIIRNLINFTRKHNKFQECDTDIDEIYNNEDMKYYQNYDKHFIMDDIFKELRHYFDGKPKFVKLTELLEHYHYDNLGKKFVKKHFIEFSKAYNFSPAITNTFFAYIKRLIHSRNKEIQELLSDGDWT